MNRQKIVVVEPHCDDAFLSVGWHIQEFWKEDDVTIVTVFSDKKRTKEAQEYAAAVGAKSLVIGLQEEKMLSEAKPRKLPQLTACINKLQMSLDFDKILFPIGLQHPDHKSVYQASFESSSTILRTLFYLDTPYQTKQKLNTELSQAISNRPVYSIMYPSKLKWRKVSIFKSQAKFFHYNKHLETAMVPEIILRGTFCE